MTYFFNYFNQKKRNQYKGIHFTGKILYIHIPKTGGTSVTQALGLKTNSHIKAKDMLKTESGHLLKKHFSFSVVRNPFDRFISLYNYARMEKSYYHDNINPDMSLFGKHLDYDLLKKASLNECAQFLLEGKLQHDKSYNHWDRQSSWVIDENEELLVNKIYKLEALNELKDDLKMIFNINLEIPTLNSSNRGHVSLDKETRKIIQEYYKKDFEIFDY